LKLNKIPPTDCSESSAKAIAETVSLARLTGGTVDVLHVTTSPGGWIWGRRARSTRERFDTFLASSSDGLRSAVTPRLETGVSYEVIVQVAKDDGYDLIVMSTHGRTVDACFLRASDALQMLVDVPLDVSEDRLHLRGADGQLVRVASIIAPS